MPSLILASGESVHIKNRVYAFGGASFDDPVNEAETILLDDARVQVVHEVSMIDWDADAVQSQRTEEFGIASCKEVVEKLVAWDQQLPKCCSNFDIPSRRRSHTSADLALPATLF